MAAERDTQQGMTFIYSNFYQLYRQGKLQSASPAAEPAKGQILQTRSKTETPTPAEVKVLDSKQTHEYAKWTQPAQNIRAELKSLREVRQRLQFLTQELDELLKRS